MFPDYMKRSGYRLATESEWEYACRAGAGTSRYYGDSEELLGKYGWYMKNSGDRTWPVGNLKPNDLGLFDMHGNVDTWCQGRYGAYSRGKTLDGFLGSGRSVIEDREYMTAGLEKEWRVLRGGAFPDRPGNLRSSSRNWFQPGNRNTSSGFRPARTYN